MKKKNIISIINRQIIDSERDNIKVMTTGTYIKKDKRGYIIYEDCKDTPFSDRTPISIIKIESPELIFINKIIGQHRSQLILEKGKRHYCQYKTEYGFMTLGVYTKCIDCNLEKSTAEIYIKYFMDVNACVTSVNEVYINVKENGKDVKHFNNVD